MVLQTYNLSNWKVKEGRLSLWPVWFTYRVSKKGGGWVGDSLKNKK